jgi:hypothetical protein
VEKNENHFISSTCFPHVLPFAAYVNKSDGLHQKCYFMPAFHSPLLTVLAFEQIHENCVFSRWPVFEGGTCEYDKPTDRLSVFSVLFGRLDYLISQSTVATSFKRESRRKMK